MPQTNYTPIQLYRSATPSAAPSAANLLPGELALNYVDGRLYFENSSNVVQIIGATMTSAVATFLGTPSSANLAAAVTNETGSGALVFGTSPTLTTPSLTTPSMSNPAITGQAGFAGGTAGAPSITRTGDLDTGLFFPASNIVALSAGGSEFLRASSTAGIVAYQQVTLTNGTASAPAIVFDGGANNGLYYDSTASAVVMAGGGSGVFGADNVGRIYGVNIHNGASISGTTYQYIGSGSGVYTSTIVSNIDALGLGDAAIKWARDGNTVALAGYVNINPTTINTATTFRVAPPIPSNFSGVADFSGSGTFIEPTSATSAPVAVYADTVNDAIFFQFRTPTANSGIITFSGCYEIL